MTSCATQSVRARGNDVAMHGLYEISKLLAAAPEPRSWLPEVLSTLCDFLELWDARIALYNAGAEATLIGAKHAPSATNAPLHTFSQAALRRARSCSLPWVVDSSWEDASLHPTASAQDALELDSSFISVPIKQHARVLGVLCIQRCHGPCDQEVFCFDADVRLLSLIANVIAACEPGGAQPQPPSQPVTDADGGTTPAPSHIIGESPCWQATLERARAAARRSSTVLLRGESGTGKELLARLIHESSPRSQHPFVTLNCAALSESVLGSELFGHEKGAFTGAVQRRSGRFELAHRGTLFLDEIGEISGTFQASLLRVLQLGEFERVGGTSTLKVDVRLIAATHRNLEQEVREGRFRADLYYRLSVVPLRLPSLRERPDDIPLLAREFLRQFNRRHGTQLALDTSAVAALRAHDYPGNVRELENCIQRAATLASGTRLRAADFSWLTSEPRPERFEQDAPVLETEQSSLEHEHEHEHELAGARERLIAAMERAGWVQAKAARILGITPRQIAYALQKYQIPLRRF